MGAGGASNCKQEPANPGQQPSPALPFCADLWGGTPFANLVHLSFGSQAAWNNASALAGTSGYASAAEMPPEGLNNTAWQAALGSLHRTVCAAYFLPGKYQGAAPRAEVGLRAGSARVPAARARLAVQWDWGCAALWPLRPPLPPFHKPGMQPPSVSCSAITNCMLHRCSPA